MNTTKHMHCVLRRVDGAKQVSFIPEKFAEIGRFLKLKNDGEWSNGWEVINVYPPLIDSEVVQARSRDYKSHRKATDV